MSLDLRLMEILETRKRADLQQGAAPSGTGGGGRLPPEGPLEPRVRALELSVASINTTLAVMSEQLKQLATSEDVQTVRTELAVVSGKIDTNVAGFSGRVDTTLALFSSKIDRMASAADVAALSGRVDGNFATLSGKIDRMASATDLAELEGRVARIPTVPVLTSILLFVSLLFAAAAWPSDTCRIPARGRSNSS